MRPLTVQLVWLVFCLGLTARPAAAAAPCGGDFAAWLQGVKQAAAAQGISQGAI